MKGQLTIAFLLIVNVVNAQFTNPVYNDWTNGYTVGVQGRYQLSSNALISNFVWNIYQGKSLDRKLRESVSNKLVNTNRVGVDLDYGIFASHLPDSSKGIGWFVNIADRTHANAKFPKDLLNIAMFGNAMYADQTADLGDIRLTFLTYKQYELGLLKQFKKETGTWNFGIGLSLLTGNRSLSVNISEADLYTQPDGEYLEGQIHGNVDITSLSSAQYFDANGLGMSASLHVGFQAEKFGVEFEADDLGFISWTTKLQNIKLDSVFVFEGAEVDLFSSNGNPFSSINLDTVISGFATEEQNQKFSTTVPGRFRLQGHYNMNQEKWKLYAGVQYRLVPGYFPYIFVGTSSPLPAGFFMDGRFAYGGFGSWNIGLEVKKRFKNVFEIRLGTNNLEGYVLPMVGTSQSAYMGLTCFFK